MRHFNSLLCGKRGVSRLVGLFCLAQLFSAKPVLAQEEEITVQVTGALYVAPSGNGRIRMTYAFTPSRAYDRVRKLYPNLYVLFRDFGVNRASFDINRSSVQIEADDSSRTITFKGDALGIATCRSDRWELSVSPEEQIVTRVENRIFTTSARRVGSGMLLSGKFEYILPSSAKIVEYAPERKKLTFTQVVKKVAGAPKVDIQLRTKKRLMGSVYKIYADAEASSGAYWVAKTVVKNVGATPIYDLRITYRLGEYSDESVAQKYALVAPQGAVVDAYYPVISARVARLRSRTPTELRVRYEYKDANGKTYSDQVAERIELLGINQFEFSNLSDDDRTDSWFDAFNNARLLVAFVMKNDEAVRQFAGIVSDAAGGVRPRKIKTP